MSEARKIYLNSGGQIPRDWMLSMIVDPGHTMCGVLFIATPPPKLGFERFVFNELAIQHCTAPMFGDRVEHVVRPLHKFQRFIIDAHGGALTSMESGISPRQAYSKELRKHGISCVETGHNFRSGSDDIAGRETELRTWLSLQHGSGEPKVFIDVQMCPRLVRTLPRFLKKEINGIVQEEANRRLECHHIECLEYGAADGLDYISPPKGEQKKVNRVQMILDRMKQDQLRRETKNWIPGVEETISLGPRS